MFLLEYFTEDAYDQLLHNIDKNEEKYTEDNDWIAEYFAGQKYYCISQSVFVNDFSLNVSEDLSDSQKSVDDLTNTRILYDACKNLTPLQASNKYMWTYLCHGITKYWEYIQARWMGSDRTNTIKTRYFVTDATTSLYDNALSRLWWYGYLTYDKDSDDPYWLTRILLTNQTICTDVMDTMNRMNLTRMKGILLAIQDFNECLNKNEGITEYFRECKKYLNHYAAVTNFDYLNYEEIRDLAFNYMVKLKNQKDFKVKNKH